MFTPAGTAESSRDANGSIVDSDGRVRLRVSAQAGGASRSRQIVSLDPAHPSLWYEVDGAVYATAGGNGEDTTPVVQLPPHKSDEVTAVTADGKRLYVARGRYVYAFDRLGDTPHASVKLDANVYSLAVTDEGTLLAMTGGWYFRGGVLVALEAESLARRWLCADVYAYPVVVRGGAVVCLREHEDRYAYISVSLDDGGVEELAQATGAPAGWMRPVGEWLVTIVQDDSGAIGRSTNNLYLERFHPGKRKRTVTPLKLRKNGFGDITSSLAILTGDNNTVVPVVAVSGKQRSVILCRKQRLVTIPVREDEHLEKHGRLVVLGNWIALAVRSRVHLIDVARQRHVSTIHLAGQVEQLGVYKGELIVRTRDVLYRLEPGEHSDAGTRITMLRAEPWELGDGNALTDGDPKTSYAFPGDGRVVILFPAPTVVSSVRVEHGPGCGRWGRIQRIDVYATNEPFGRPAGPLLRVDPAPEEGNLATVLSGDAIIARQLTLILQCRPCNTGPRDPLCEIAELVIE